MDFDHVRGKKKFSLSKSRNASSKMSIRREISKCDLVCANCHRDRTQRRLGDVRSDPELVLIPESVPSAGQWDESDRTRVRIRVRVRVLRKKRRLETSEFIRSLKHEKICSDCNLSHPYWRLDFDHRDSKTVNVSLIASRKHWGKERILEEVAKCDLVCANCHRLRTFYASQKCG
jgi:hypothetical protein